MRPVSLLLLAALAAGALPARPARAAAGRAETLHAAPLGPVVDAPDGTSEMELVRFDDRLLAALEALAPETSTRVEEWPIAPGRRAAVFLRRIDVYAPDAKIVVIEDGVEREAPRSRVAFFHGLVLDGQDAGSRLAAWLDPDTGRVGGFAMTSAGTVVLSAPDGPGGQVVRVARAGALDPPGETPSWTCGMPDDAGDPLWRATTASRTEKAALSTVRTGSVSALGALTRSAVIAFDTDAEYLNLRFANDTTAATNYVAQLVAGMSVIYERDVASVQGNGVKMLQGYTILRVGETSDPYSDATGSADSAKLDEFGAYWDAQYPSSVVHRALAALLSGRQGSSNSASGIAWAGTLCASSTYGYSVNQLFTGAFGVTADLGILAHEVGHNFGALHTHSCRYSPPIDTCVTPEGGCTAATGCPGSQTFNGVTTNGTLMSYCHMIGCSPRNLVFHTRSVADAPSSGISVLNEVAGATCLATLSGGMVPPAPTITSVSPPSGPLAGGTTLTITGTNFVSGVAVSFVELPSNNVFGTPSSRAAASVTWNGSTQLTVTTPAASAAGAVDVVVMNPDFQTATRAGGFSYTVGPAGPVVASIFPNNGSTLGGTSVTISGSGFVAGATVSLGGVAATSVVVASATTITAVTGAHATGTVGVTVTNPGNVSGTLPLSYFYVPPPTPISFYSLTPCRVVDTRPSAGGTSLAPGATRSFTVTGGACGVPADAKSISGNVTVVSGTAPGYLALFPGNGLAPPTSNTNFSPSQVRANNVLLLLATDGSGLVGVLNGSSGTNDLILDVNGFFR